MYYNKKRLLLSILWVIIGVLFIALSIGKIIDNVYSGMGVGLIVIGCLNIYKNFKYRNDLQYREKIDIELTDERNRYLRMKSWSFAGYTTVLIGAIASLIAFFFGYEEIQKFLLLTVCFIVFVYWLSYTILKRKC